MRCGLAACALRRRAGARGDRASAPAVGSPPPPEAPRLASSAGATGGGVHYVIDPTGWGIQMDGDETKIMPGCEQKAAAKDEDDRTAFHWAEAQDHEEVASLLREREAAAPKSAEVAGNGM